jgi:hypothetical protein
VYAVEHATMEELTGKQQVSNRKKTDKRKKKIPPTANKNGTFSGFSL